VVSQRGQITIPKALRKKYKINVGEKVLCVDSDDHISLLPISEKDVSPRYIRGDPRAILEFLNTHEPLSEEAAKELMDAVEKGRKAHV
jgi:AbrB family looped-hinge helix DNA binding protein